MVEIQRSRSVKGLIKEPDTCLEDIVLLNTGSERNFLHERPDVGQVFIGEFAYSACMIWQTRYVSIRSIN